jgi:hypothetical protein
MGPFRDIIPRGIPVEENTLSRPVEVATAAQPSPTATARAASPDPRVIVKVFAKNAEHGVYLDIKYYQHTQLIQVNGAVREDQVIHI